MRTRIKICGITRVEDGLAASAMGADAIGLVFYEPSPRYVDIAQAKRIVSALPAFVTTVALFVDADPERVRQVIAEVQVDLLQFHGKETPEYCNSFNRPWIKAVRMKDNLDLHAVMEAFAAGRGLLLDAYSPGVPGGTGESFDWSRVPREYADKIILAGGLDAENVAQAVSQVRPYAVDVSGGVEASKGIKDADKIAQFIRGVRVGEK